MEFCLDRGIAPIGVAVDHPSAVVDQGDILHVGQGVPDQDDEDEQDPVLGFQTGLQLIQHGRFLLVVVQPFTCGDVYTVGDDAHLVAALLGNALTSVEVLHEGQGQGNAGHDGHGE